MTKIEYAKCEKAMDEAILNAQRATYDYVQSERIRKEGGCEVTAECKLRCADQHLGYAEGITQVLDMIGFKHDKMNELRELI